MAASTYTDRLAALICERLAEGQSLREICRDNSMPAMSTVFRWLAANESFREQYARAREAQADAFGEDIIDIADDATNDWMLRRQGEDTVEVINSEHISRSKLRVDARKWLMSKMAPKKYGDRIDSNIKHEHGVSDPLMQLLSEVAQRGRRIHDR